MARLFYLITHLLFNVAIIEGGMPTMCNGDLPTSMNISENTEFVINVNACGEPMPFAFWKIGNFRGDRIEGELINTTRNLYRYNLRIAALPFYYNNKNLSIFISHSPTIFGLASKGVIAINTTLSVEYKPRMVRNLKLNLRGDCPIAFWETTDEYSGTPFTYKVELVSKGQRVYVNTTATTFNVCKVKMLERPSLIRVSVIHNGIEGPLTNYFSLSPKSSESDFLTNNEHVIVIIAAGGCTLLIGLMIAIWMCVKAKENGLSKTSDNKDVDSNIKKLTDKSQKIENPKKRCCNVDDYDDVVFSIWIDGAPNTTNKQSQKSDKSSASDADTDVRRKASLYYTEMNITDIPKAFYSDLNVDYSKGQNHEEFDGYEIKPFTAITEKTVYEDYTYVEGTRYLNVQRNEETNGFHIESVSSSRKISAYENYEISSKQTSRDVNEKQGDCSKAYQNCYNQYYPMYKNDVLQCNDNPKCSKGEDGVGYEIVFIPK